jgi:hypothetical protein
VTIFSVQPSPGYDTFLHEGYKTSNYDGNGYMAIGVSGSRVRGLIKFDISSIPAPVQIVSASLQLHIGANYRQAATLASFRCLRNHVNGTATWNVFSTGNNWGTAGCDNSTTDYVNTDLGNVAVAGANAYYTINFNANGLAVIQNWISGGYTNYGFLLKHTSEVGGSYNDYDSGNNGTAAYRPLLTIEYTWPVLRHTFIC